MRKFFSFKNLALALLLVVTIVAAQVFSAQAQTGQQGNQLGLGGIQVGCNTGAYNIHGQLFSSNIGFVYLNCADYGAPSNNFGVTQDAQGYWKGYGWSPSVGWIKFGDVGCPQHSGWNVTPAAGASGCDVQRLPLQGNTISIVGWARACVAATSPSTCSGDTSSSSGAWDGWISMNGLNDQNPTAAGLQTTQSYKTTLGLVPNQNGQQPISGFVWGSDVIGWAKFTNAYVDTTQTQNAAHITLTATPASVTGNNPVSLTYSINAAEKAYFTGAACTATSSPVAGSPWNGSQPNFSSSSTVFTKTVSSVSVPSDPTTYTITCPVSVPGSSQATATASVTVTKAQPAITLTINDHNLCVAGSLGGPQSTTASWVGAGNASYCTLYRDGVATANQQQQIGSVTVGAFSNTTSNPYVTPSTPGDQHEYYVRCYDASNNQIGESNHEFVGVAPATFNGSTGSGSLNCTQASWGITLGSVNANGGSCVSGQSNASLGWTPWGTVSAQYTYAILKRSTTQFGTYTTVGTYSLADTEPSINASGWYKVVYATNSGTESQVVGGPVYISGTSTIGGCFSGLPSGGPYCPAGSVNTGAVLPKTYSWTSDAASCQLDGSASTVNGSVAVSSAPQSHSLVCTWSDGSTATSMANYGPMLAAESAFCSSTSGGGRPVIIEK